MYYGNQPRMYRRPEPTRAELYAALQRTQQDNQHLRQRLAQRRAGAASADTMREEIARLRAENAQIKEHATQLSASLAAVKDENTRRRAPADAQARAQRLSADIANLRRRQSEEVDRARRAARAALLREFVESLDALERALESDPNPGSAWHQGTEGVRRQMLSTLSRAGVERLGAVGAPFDPRVHEAIGLDPTASVAAEHIARVVQPGYRFADTQSADALIRPARVIVAG